MCVRKNMHSLHTYKLIHSCLVSTFNHIKLNQFRNKMSQLLTIASITAICNSSGRVAFHGNKLYESSILMTLLFILYLKSQSCNKQDPPSVMPVTSSSVKYYYRYHITVYCLALSCPWDVKHSQQIVSSENGQVFNKQCELLSFSSSVLKNCSRPIHVIWNWILLNTNSSPTQ
jgi:hypothetical protein